MSAKRDPICDALGWKFDGVLVYRTGVRGWSVCVGDAVHTSLKDLPLEDIPLCLATHADAPEGSPIYDVDLPYLSKRLELGI